MGLQREEVILEIDISSYLDQQAEQINNITELKKLQSELNKEVKKGNEEAAKSLAAVNTALKVQQDEARATARVIEGYTKQKKLETDTVNFSNNSIAQNRALLKQLVDQYNSIRNPSKQFTDQIKSLTDTLKAQESAIGNNARNVGNYKEAIVDAAQSIRIMGYDLGGVINPLKNVSAGFNEFGISAKGLGVAFSGLGLPLLITGINALIEAFSSLKPVADAVEEVIAGISAAFTTSYAEGVKLVRLKRELEDADRAAIVVNAQLQKSINELERQAADKTKSDQERIALLEEANRKRDELVKGDINRAKINAEISEREVKQSEAINKSRSETLALLLSSVGLYETAALVTVKGSEASDAALNKQANSLADLIKLEDSYNQQVIDNDNKINQLRKSIADDEKARLEQQKKDAEERAKFIEEQNALTIEAANAIEAENERIDRIRNEVALRQAYRLKKEIDDRNAALNEIRKNAELEISLLEYVDENRAAFAANGVTITQQTLDAEYDATYLQYQNYADFIAKKRALYQKDVETYNKAEAQKQQATQATASAVGSAANSIIGFIGQVADAQGAGAEFAKALALVQIIVQQAVAIASAVAGGASAGASTGPGAIATTPAFIATLVGAVTAVIGGAISLLSKPVPKASFAEGGDVFDVGGFSHAQGGTVYRGEDGNAFEVERGEKIFVLKKTASDNINMLSAFNQMYGGRSWTGNPVTYAANGGAVTFSDGGYNSRAQRKAVDEAAILEAAINRGFRNAPQPVVSVKEFTRVKTSYENSVSISEI